ncbi:MAG: hypothetical protein WKF59_03340 [Chitinophagaceae bacterium]
MSKSLNTKMPALSVNEVNIRNESFDKETVAPITGLFSVSKTDPLILLFPCPKQFKESKKIVNMNKQNLLLIYKGLLSMMKNLGQKHALLI